MNKDAILRKITSRKFIITVALLIFSTLCVTHVIPVDIQDVWKELILGYAVAIAYIFSEGATDIAGVIQKGDTYVESDNDEPTVS